jgi:hypothetical protein
MRPIVQGFLFGAGIILLAAFFASGFRYARGADLPVPKPRPVPEECVAPDVKPSPGQTIRADTACPSGLRWSREK